MGTKIDYAIFLLREAARYLAGDRKLELTRSVITTLASDCAGWESSDDRALNIQQRAIVMSSLRTARCNITTLVQGNQMALNRQVYMDALDTLTTAETLIVRELLSITPSPPPKTVDMLKRSKSVPS